MALILAVVGALSAIVLVVLVASLARRLARLAQAMTALQRELLPALDAIQKTSEQTRRLAASLEERARVLRRDPD